MSTIEFRREHHLGPEEARAAAQKVADEMTRDFGLACEWDGDVLRFARAGVSGCMSLQPDGIALTAELGFLYAAFKDRIEAQLHRNFDAYFG